MDLRGSMRSASHAPHCAPTALRSARQRAATVASAVPQAPRPITVTESKAAIVSIPPAFCRVARRAWAFRVEHPARAGWASIVSVRPSARRSAPAQAIIAPLSVQSAGGGHDQLRPGLPRHVKERATNRLIGGDAAGRHQRMRCAEPFAEKPQAYP